METDSILKLLRLRLLVCLVGELASPPWWKTQFFSPVGMKQLGRLFPRSPLRAAIESVTLVAGQDHDERVGARAFHLFRLPTHLELSIADVLAEPSALATLELPVYDLSSALSALESVAEGGVRPQSSGPHNLGSSARLPRNGCLAELAAAYLASFRAYSGAASQAEGSLRVLPYFEPEDSP